MLPILYESTYVSIQTVWVMTAIALLTASYLAVQRLKRRRVNFTLFIEHSTGFLISALIGSRIVYFFSNTSQYFPSFDLRTAWNFISIWDQGLSFWGAFIGFLLMLTYRIIKEKEELWKWYDALIVPGLVGIGIGNIGAFLGGYSYGKPTSLPWGVTYEVFNVKYTVPIHPTQIYGLLGIILILWSKKKLKEKTQFFETEGNTTVYLSSTFCLLYFLIEFLRGDDRIMLLGMRLSSILFLIALLISSFHLFKRYRAYKSLKS